MLLYILTLMKQAYLLTFSPFAVRRDTVVDMVNEGLVTVSLMLYVGLASCEEIGIQKGMGFWVISMVILSIAINLGIVVWRIMVESVVPKIKLYCRKRTKIEDKQQST